MVLFIILLVVLIVYALNRAAKNTEERDEAKRKMEERDNKVENLLFRTTALELQVKHLKSKFVMDILDVDTVKVAEIADVAETVEANVLDAAERFEAPESKIHQEVLELEAPELEIPESKIPEPAPENRWQKEVEEPSFLSSVSSKIRDYAQKGTLWLAVGGVVLTLGVGFLIQYTWNQELISGVGRQVSAGASVAGRAAGSSYTVISNTAASFASIIFEFMSNAEARLMLSAFVAIALLASGWLLRDKRRVHALILQGIGTGLFFVTIFAASAINGLLAMPYAFALTALTVVCTGILAVKQDSEELAWAAAAIGFAAPILTGAEAASGAVYHFRFFAYYSLLNAGIFIAARFRVWHGLSLLGFLCTYIALAGWSIFDYPLHTFFGVAPFFVLFFLGYTWITTRMILKGNFSIDRTADAVLLIGTPVAFCSLQFPLAWHVGDMAALTAYALGIFYTGLGCFMHRKRSDITSELKWTIKASLCAGILFINLAILLSLTPNGIAVASLLLGVAAVIAGIKAKNAEIRVAGVVFQCAGAAFLFFSADLSSGFAIWRLSPTIVAILAAAGAFVCYFTALLEGRKNSACDSADSPEMRLMFVWGLVWAYGAIGNWAFFSGAFSFPFYILLIFYTLIGVFFMMAGRRLGSSFIQIPAVFPALLALYLFASAIIEGYGPFPLAEFLSFPGGHPLAGMGIVAWPVFFIGQSVTLALLERGAAEKRGEAEIWEAVLPYLHGGNFVFFTMMLAAEMGNVLSIGFAGINLYWIDLIIVMFLIMIINAVTSKNGVLSRLSGSRHRSYSVAGCGMLCAALCLWAVASLILPGDSSPLAFVPLFNPLAFAELAIFLTMTWWYLQVAGLYPEFEAWITGRVAVAVCVVLMMVWSTVETARVFHFYGGVPFTVASLWGDLVFQTTITFLWGLWSLGMMRFGSRRVEHRRIWNIGALLLSCNVFKLIFADLAGTGTLTRVFSFMGLGVLLITIGFLTPLPEREN